MKISVIIPSFNRSKTIRRAINSILEQTYYPHEIIIIDDGSTDGTQSLIRDEYPSVKYYYQLNKGVSNARNKGILKSTGDWIAFLDSDDEWFPNKLEEQKKSLEQNSTTFISHTNEIWIRNGVRVNQMKKHQKYGGSIFDKCLEFCRISPSSVLIHKRVFDDVGNFDEDLMVCEDYDLWIRITSKYLVEFLDIPLIKKYGGHKDQLSKVKNGIENFRIQSLEKVLLSKILTKKQELNAKEVLLKKLSIYSNGLKKRNKLEELEHMKKKILNWTITL
jgi:glycosyltransferase involved in cell wall biosynthesis